jgi:hypothetical protein
VIRCSSVHVITRLKLDSVCTLIMLDTWANLTASLFFNMISDVTMAEKYKRLEQDLVVDGLVFEVVQNC